MAGEWAHQLQLKIQDNLYHIPTAESGTKISVIYLKYNRLVVGVAILHCGNTAPAQLLVEAIKFHAKCDYSIGNKCLAKF